jgi:hypothetical protein
MTVQIFSGGVQVGAALTDPATRTAANYDMNWDTTAIADGTFSVQATGQQGSCTSTVTSSVTLQTATCTGTVTISAPTNGSSFNRGCHLVPITVGVTGSAWSGMTVKVLDSTSTVIRTLTDNTSRTNANYTFTWDNSNVANGTYTIKATGTQAGPPSCSLDATPVSITLAGTAANCLTLVTQAGVSPAFQNGDTYLEFKVQNACASAVTINGITPSWSSSPNPGKQVSNVQYNAVDVGVPGSPVNSGTSISFNVGTVTIPASSTSNIFRLIFTQPLTAGATRTTFPTMIMQTTVPRNEDVCSMSP